jgi:hypothetical protein
MLVGMTLMGSVQARGIAFVPVALVLVVSVAVVEVIRVASVLHGGVAAAGAMGVRVLRVGCVCGHEFVLSLA